MNVFHKLTLESLKKNKTRTIVTIIGIILSTAMICAVASLSSSFHNYLVNIESADKGSWHVKLEETNKDNLEKLQSDERVDSIAYAKEEGYAKVYNKENEEIMLYILSAADGFEDIMPVHIVDGHYPSNENEIIVPTHLAKSRRVYYDIGDQITLNVGKRMYNGEQLHQSNHFYYPDHKDNGEEFVHQGQKQFTVVGIYERPSFETPEAIGYTVITKLNGELTQSDTINAYAKLKNPLLSEKMSSEIKDSKINKSLLHLYGIGFGENSDMQPMLMGLIAIILGLIIFASVALIYNAFSISVSERTKQFGLLSSLGATKKQIRKMVNFEAFVLSIIGIPLGIISGLIGIAITLHFISDKITSLGIWTYIVPFEFYVHPIFIVGAVILALLTIFISAYKPSLRATKVTAIEAIRQTKDVKIKKSSIKTPKWVYKLYGLPGMLASKNYKRSAKKYRATVISLTMSIILFISAFSFSDYMIVSLKASGIPQSDVELILGTDEATDIYDKVKNVQSADASALTIITYSVESLANSIMFIDDDNFKDLLKENSLKESDYTDKDNPKALIYKPIRTTKDVYTKLDETDEKEGKTTLYFPKKITGYDLANAKNEGDYMMLEYSSSDGKTTKKFRLDEVAKPVVVNLGKEIKNVPFYFQEYPKDDLLVLPMSMKQEILPEDSETAKYINSRVDFLAKDHKNCEKQINAILDEIEEENPIGFMAYTTDITEILELNKTMILVMRVFCYGFVALLTLISCANVFNTISTNISLRRREFAMLQSIGMTNKEMDRMMRFECMKYGLSSLLIGIPISLGITALIHLSVSNNFEMAFRFPTTAILICIVSIFALVFSTMLYSMRKIKKQNTVETLKDENQ